MDLFQHSSLVGFWVVCYATLGEAIIDDNRMGDTYAY